MAKQGSELLAQAVAAHRGALEVCTRQELPDEWANTQWLLGHALLALSQQSKEAEGLKLQQESIEAFRELTAYQPSDDSRLALAEDLGGLAFILILNPQFADAQADCEEAQMVVEKIGEGMEKDERENLIFIRQNLAHALLFQGRYNEALAIYRENWNKPLNGKTFGEITLEDFAAFDKAALTHPDLSRMRQELGSLH